MKTSSHPYRIRMSDGKTYAVNGRNAGEAMAHALRDHPGFRVIDCYSGLTEEDCRQIRKMDRTARPIPGATYYEVPPHQPHPRIEPKRPTTAPAEPDLLPMGEIESESKRAKDKADYGRKSE